MTTKKALYVEGIGRRKTATARVRLTPASKASVTVNNKELSDYFPHQSLQNDVQVVFGMKDLGIENYHVEAKVQGGGLSAQAEAIRLGIARALVKESAPRRTALKKEGFLKRDQRSVERKKFGLRKARKRPAWSKR
jgi:small subunit ribosomal protein S9